MRGGYRIPMHGNLPVPYVTRYTTEEPGSVAGLEPTFQLIVDRTGPKGEPLWYLDDKSGLCLRDEAGWLWVPSPDDRSGKPQFSQLHPLRHRRCMVEYRCQVCARPMGPKVRFRVRLDDIQADDGSSWMGPLAGFIVQTSQAPVCERCERAANAKCPHLVKFAPEWTTIEAERKDIKRVGVLGDVYYPDNNGGADIIFQGLIKDGHPYAPMTWARQAVVEIRNSKVVRRPT